MIDLESLLEQAKQMEKENRAFFKNMKKSRHRELDDVIHDLHEEEFRCTNCLECANCCRTLGPRITDKDIERLAQALRKKPAEIIATYLRVDEDGDSVFKTMPCPFLGADNYCSVYQNRPKACREYPHTDRKKFFQIHALTLRNAETCPAVFNIIEALKRKMN